jgi:hypothetical protein
VPEFIYQLLAIIFAMSLFIANVSLLKCYQVYTGTNFKEFLQSKKPSLNEMKKKYVNGEIGDPFANRLFHLYLISSKVGFWGLIITMILMVFNPLFH